MGSMQPLTRGAVPTDALTVSAWSAEAGTAAESRKRTMPWVGVVFAVLAALATYFLRSLLGFVGLQALTFIVPTLAAAYFFGSLIGVLTAALTLAVVHAILWVESPQILFTPGYFRGIFNFALISTLIVLYTYRHEKVLRRLDHSLAQERAARAQAEEANRLKDQFLATLSHELRTPINVILGYLQILLADRTADPRKALEIVNRNAQQQARLIEDVLDVSRISAGTIDMKAEEVLPAAVMREAVESLLPAIGAKGLRVDVASEDRDEATILADPYRLRQIFWNILSNAVKFTPSGGSIRVEVKTAGAHVDISVRDTGRGIGKDFLPYVFDMFRQADASMAREVTGMGVGLNLVKRFVELQGGEVSVSSAGEGQGATFTCRFPIRRRHADRRREASV